MKKLSLLLLSILLAATLAQAKQAILTGYSGTVEVQPKGATVWRKAIPKMLLKEGEKIRTGKRSKATLIFEDGSRTEVYPETTIVMQQLAAPVSMEQTAGRTRNSVKKLGKGFSMRTPTAVCSVRGTEFEVGFNNGQTDLNVYEGTVNGLKLATGESMDVPAGMSMTFGADKDPLGAPKPMEGSQGQDSSLKQMAKKEVGLDMTREQIQAAAAEEMKLAEYQEGKSLIDVNGFRVRLEEYVTRKDASGALLDGGKGFKFVVLNTRENRFDFFTYRGVFNKLLPSDLSIALNNVTGRHLGSTAPEYYLTSYEMAQSNLTDAIKDMADGGHLVKVTYDGTTYTLSAYGVNADGSPTSAPTDANVTQLGSANGKIYDPVADVYKNPGVSLDGVYNPADDTFKTMKSGDTLWRTQFNRYAHLMGKAKDLAALTLDSVPSGTLPQPWFQYYTKASGITNIATLETINNSGFSQDDKYKTLSVDGKSIPVYKDESTTQASFKYLNGRFATDVRSPSGSDKLHVRITIYYPKSDTDAPYERYDTYIISDEGKIAPVSAFAGATSGKAFKEQLLKWNYEQKTTSTAFDKDIDIVAEPKILIRSGLIK